MPGSCAVCRSRRARRRLKVVITQTTAIQNHEKAPEQSACSYLEKGH